MRTGRPKKEINFEEILILSKQGLSTRAIARNCNISHMTISRFLLHCNKSPNTSKKSKTVTKVQNCNKSHSEDKVEKHGEAVTKIISGVSGSAGSTTTHTPSSSITTTFTFDSHHSGFSSKYTGKQPKSGRSWAMKGNRNNMVYTHDLEPENVNGAIIQIHTGKLKLWLNNTLGTRGNTPEQIEASIKGRARAIIGEFARNHDIIIDWKSLQKMTDKHLTVKDEELNEILSELFESAPEIARKMGWVNGDSSHPDQNELKGEEGMRTAKGIREIFYELPETVAMIADNQKIMIDSLKLYNEQNMIFSVNIEKHMAVLNKMEKNQEKMNILLSKLIKKLG
jgi:hypothetical protein